jgi:hypothetical protein
VAWRVSIAPDVIRYIRSVGFREQSPDQILQAVESYLAHHGDQCRTDRWNRCPDDFFVYSHVLVDGGRLHTLEFIVKDASAERGVLKVVWVEHYLGGEFP